MTTEEWSDADSAACGTAPATESRASERPARPSPATPGARHARQLRRTIETEIVPRLIAARARGVLDVGREGGLSRPGPAPRRHIEPADCLELQRLLLAHESTMAGAYLEALVNQGVLREEIYMDLLVPVARGFGRLWEEDLADFTQITVALGRLQVLLHELGRDACESADAGQGMRSALLIPTPGEQHTFGLLVISDFFRRSGWNVCNEFPKSAREIDELAAHNHFDVIGFSLAAEAKLADLKAMIPALRRASQNASLCILVGGPIFVHQPALALEIGADGTGADGAAAVAEAERLLGKRVEMH